MQRDPPLAEAVGRDRVASRGERRDARIDREAVPVRVRVLVVAPGDERAVRADADLCVEHRGGTRRRIGELLLARPLHQDRPLREQGEHRRLERRVAHAVAAVGPAGHPRHDTDPLLREAERARDLGPQAERPLRAGVDRRLVGPYVGDRGGGPDRRVRDVWQHVARLDDVRCGRERRVDAVVLTHRDHDGLLIVAIRGRPVGLERVERGLCLRGAFGHHAGEVPIADHPDPRHRPRGRVVERTEARAADRRLEPFAVEHPVETHVGDVRRAAGHDVARLDTGPRSSEHAMLARRRERDVVGDLARERRVRREGGVREAARAVADPAVADRAVGDREPLARDAELFARAAQQLLARVGGRLPQCVAVLRDRAAPERPAVEGHLRGVAHDHAHPLRVEPQLLRDDLREGGANALPELDLAREGGDRSVRLEADPLLDQVRDRRVGGAASRRGRHARGALAHLAAHPAARFTARIARVYTPQRQRLASSRAARRPR